MRLGTLKDLGIITTLMPNGFNLYTINPTADVDNQFTKIEYNESLDKNEVVYISSDPDGDFTPAIFIKND